MDKKLKKRLLRNKIVDMINNIVKPSNVAINLLATISSVASGFLSFAGALALGATVPVGIAALFLTALVSQQVNLEMIESAIKRLKHFKENLFSNLLILTMSILAAISFSATTLFAAIGLFTFSTALLITIVSSLAFFFISYDIIHESWDILKGATGRAFANEDQSTSLDLSSASKIHSIWRKIKQVIINVKNELLEPLKDLLKNRSLFSQTVIMTLCILFSLTITVSCIYLTIVTFPTWWIETSMGLALLIPLTAAHIIRVASAGFGALAHSLFTIKNSIQVVAAFIKLALVKWAAYDNKSEQSPAEKKNLAVHYNPFNYLVIGVVKGTAILLFLAHSLCHALMAGRDSAAAIIGTVLDFLADANYTLVPKSTKPHDRVAHAHEHCGHDHDHSHEPFNTIVMLTQLIITAPLQIPNIITYLCLSKKYNHELKWKQHISDSFKNCFAFVIEYIDSKSDLKEIIDLVMDNKDAVNAPCGSGCPTGRSATLTPLRDARHNGVSAGEDANAASHAHMPLRPAAA